MERDILHDTDLAPDIAPPEAPQHTMGDGVHFRVYVWYDVYYKLEETTIWVLARSLEEASDVINLKLGGNYPDFWHDPKVYDPHTMDAPRMFGVQHSENGVIFAT